MLRDRFEDHYRRLIAAWERHQSLRNGSADLPALARSRFELDRLRNATNTIRRAYAPDRIERTDAAHTLFCERLEETVFLFASDAEWTAAGPRYRCVCGTAIDGDDQRVVSH